MTPESAAATAIHYAATREELAEVAGLLLKVATWAGITGDTPLRDRCVARAGDVLAASAMRPDSAPTGAD
jgi:hypothetical protein